MGQPAKILVVDDNPVVLTNLVEVLRSAGYVVLEATTGQAGIDLARCETPDLVLLDVILPDIHGLELCRRFKSTPELEPIFLVLFSASETSSGSQARGLDAGADGYIPRPIDNRELLARVQAMLRIQRTEKALRRAQDKLEQRVAERTAELSSANLALVAEIDRHTKTEESLRRLAERLKIVNRIEQAILAAKSPREIAVAALSPMRQLVPYEHASVVELNAEFGRAEMLAAFDSEGKMIGGGWPLPAELSLRARSLRSGEPLTLHKSFNLFETPATGEAGPAKIWRLIIDLPMAIEGTLLGILNLATNQMDAFTAEHQEIAQEIATQLGVGLRQARFLEQVSAGRERLRLMSRQLVQVQEAERRFLARELHDEIGQVLTGTKIALDLAMREEGPANRLRVEEALGMLNELMGRVRRLSLDLRPQMLDDLGLLTALEWHFQRYFKQTNFRVEFKYTPMAERLPPPIETGLFRIAQEALTNVARHAGVKEVVVRLWRDTERAGILVADRGAGFDVERALGLRASIGLAGMKERAQLLGGECTLESNPGNGTRVTVELPVAVALEAAPGENGGPL